MATNWVKAQAVANSNTTLPSQSVTITNPIAGSLLTVTAYLVVNTGTGPTSFTISDNSTGQGPWTSWTALHTSAKYSVQRYYKLSDGTETSVSITGIGYSGSLASTRITVTNYTVSGGGTIAIDLAVGAASGSVSSISVSPSSGSGQPSNTDELALIYSSSDSGLTHSTASFTGTSALAAATMTGSFNGDATMEYFVGGVQASATAGTNVFQAAYGGGPGISLYDCATFYYQPSPAAFVQAAKGSSTTFANSVATAVFGTTVTTGNAIVVAIVTGATAKDVTSVTDNASGNTYIYLGSTYFVSNSFGIELWIAQNVNSVASMVVTAQDSASSLGSIIAMEVSGLATSGHVLDAYGGTTGSTNSQTATTTSAATYPNDIIIGIFSVNSTAANTWTVGGGYTNLTSTAGTSGGLNLAIETLSVLAPGTYTATMTSTLGSADGEISVVAALTNAVYPVPVAWLV
jgi:hypothetical protein